MGIGLLLQFPHLLRAGPVLLTPVFHPSSFILPSFVWVYIFFSIGPTPVHPQLVFCMHFCVWRCDPDGERCAPHAPTPPPSLSLLVLFWCFIRTWSWSEYLIIFLMLFYLFSLLHFSHSVMSDSLWRHGLQQSRPPCPSPSPGACSNSCPLSLWCHRNISSSVIPFSFLKSFPASGSFPVSQLSSSGGQNIVASASVLPVNIQDWFPIGLAGWSPCSPRDSQVSSPSTQFKSISSSALSFL